MKIVTKEEWESTPEENKKVYDDTPYMVYREDGRTCFGPVKVLEGDNIVAVRRLMEHVKGSYSKGKLSFVHRGIG